MAAHLTPIGAPTGPEAATVPVFFLSDSTGISAETMGNALLIQFPDLHFERRLIPFITSVEEARRVVTILDEAMAGPVTPLAFTTAAVEEVRLELHKTRCPLIDFFDLHMARVESILQTRGMRVAARLHGVGDIKRYNNRMAAVEYAIEHDDGQSLRALDKADVILVAPSRCGKTPTTMYLALQHGVFVANYPLVDEDLESSDLPRTAAPRPMLRHRHHPRPAQPGPPGTPPELALRLPRAVHVRAPAHRGPVPQPPHPHGELRSQVGRGDVHRDPAAVRQPAVTPPPGPSGPSPRGDPP
jgi:regulator of PEP synthase PpsR (kinase-PPPase family)